MAEAAFFYNTTTQRPDRTKPPSAHSNISINSHAQPVRPVLFKKPRSKSSSSVAAAAPAAGALAATTTTTKNEASPDAEDQEPDRMLSTPLVDYKHAANQTTKSRAAAASRKLSASGNSADRKNALSTVESRTSSAARGEAAGRSSSISSNTGSSGLTAVTSIDQPLSDAYATQPFSRRNGRKYLRDTSLPYPLPCDLAELHRQTLRTMLLCQVFNGPICSQAFNNKPPKRVLEVGCGAAFWSVMCHRHFAQRGFTSISFTGIDIAHLAPPRMDTDDDMMWRFVQHDIRRVPFPFHDEEFNLVMVKDLSMVIPTQNMQPMMDEYLRILKPGGTLEIWDGDHSLRMLLQHSPPPTKEDDDDSEDEEQLHTNAMGTYTLTPQTPLAAPQNPFLLEYNVWVSKALESKKLSSMPCTLIRPLLIQESEDLIEIDSRRLAIPLGEVRWEREGVGGAATHGTSGPRSQATSSKGKMKELDRKVLTVGQAALRRTALLTVVQMIESLEPLLREASEKGQDEWDRWHGNMMNDLLKQNGTSWGECLEVGAWWARKRKPLPPN